MRHFYLRLTEFSNTKLALTVLTLTENQLITYIYLIMNYYSHFRKKPFFLNVIDKID